MKRIFTVVLILIGTISMLQGAETNAPGWAAKYWAITNGFTGKLSVKRYEDSYMIYTNKVSTGILTKDVNQDAVHNCKVTCVMPVMLMMYLTPEGDLIPASTNVTWGTISNRIDTIYVNHLNVSTSSITFGGKYSPDGVVTGGVPITIENGKIKFKGGIVVDGNPHGGKVKIKKGDLLFESGFGVETPDTNGVAWISWGDEYGWHTNQDSGSPSYPHTKRLVNRKATRDRCERANKKSREADPNSNSMVEFRKRMEAVEERLKMGQYEEEVVH